jgi:hypothetical protein
VKARHSNSPPQTLYANVPDKVKSIDEDDDDDGNGTTSSYESVNQYRGGSSSVGGADERQGDDQTPYYNLPDLGLAKPEEDNMYIYMKSGLTTEPDTEQGENAGAKVTERKRHQSEQLLTREGTKYVNYSRGQQQARASNLNNGKTETEQESDDAPLYANCEEDLYTEVS